MSLPPSYSSLYQTQTTQYSDPPPQYRSVAYAHERNPSLLSSQERVSRSTGFNSYVFPFPYGPYQYYGASGSGYADSSGYVDYAQTAQTPCLQITGSSGCTQGYMYQPPAQLQPLVQAQAQTTCYPFHYYSSGASYPYTNPSFSYPYTGLEYTYPSYSNLACYMLGAAQPWYQVVGSRYGG